MDELVTVTQIANRLAVCDSTVRVWIRNRDFPKPIQIVPRRKWRWDEVSAWAGGKNASPNQ